MDVQTVIILIAIGIAAGMLSGLIGIGGGIIIVPCLVFFVGYSQKMAQGTSLGMLLLPAGIFAVAQFYRSGYIDVKAVGLLAAGFLLGGYLGARIALSLPEDTVKKIFAVLLIIVAIKMLFFEKKSSEQAHVSESNRTIDK